MWIGNIFKALPLQTQFKFRNSFFGQVVKTILCYRYRIALNGFYSQFGEDVILRKYLPENNGFYLDIGSGDPVRGSNTYFLYQRGWKGILIDPLTRNIFASKIVRRRDKVIQALVGAANKKYLFFEMYPYEFSTTSGTVVQELIKAGTAKLVKKVEINSLPISELNLQINLDQPSLLNIDCEGLDLEVLKTIALKKIKFRIICIEDFEFDTISQSSAINSHLNKNCYTMVERVGFSSIYVNSSWLRENQIN
jgi:FkbM family methyltransferase